LCILWWFGIHFACCYKKIFKTSIGWNFTFRVKNFNFAPHIFSMCLWKILFFASSNKIHGIHCSRKIIGTLKCLTVCCQSTKICTFVSQIHRAPRDGIVCVYSLWGLEKTFFSNIWFLGSLFSASFYIF
jgi:hypothetical protein